MDEVGHEKFLCGVLKVVTRTSGLIRLTTTHCHFVLPGWRTERNQVAEIVVLFLKFNYSSSELFQFGRPFSAWAGVLTHPLIDLFGDRQNRMMMVVTETARPLPSLAT